MSYKSTTITYKGVDLTIGGNFTPKDEGVRYYPDGSGQPPTPAEYEIQEICVVGKEEDVSKIYDSLDCIEDIAELCIEKIEEQ